MSGLGATRELFRYLHIPGYTLRPLDWITPANDEPLRTYAGRLAKGVAVEQPILLGVSFGGIVALEMSGIVSAPLVVLVSTVKNRRELPPYLRAIGKFGIHRLFPFGLLPYMGPSIRYFNGTRGSRDTEVINGIIGKMDLDHIAWGIDKLLKWNGCDVEARVLHIHGSADRVFPVRYTKPDVVVDGGPHAMIVSRAEEIGRIIAASLGTATEWIV